MTDSEVSPENQTSNDDNDVDIYSDVLCDQDSLITKLKEKVDKLSKEKELILRSLNSLQKNYEDLRKEYENLKEKFNVVSFNSSALFKTAQAEVKRKDKLINELRREKDDLVFRKVCVNQALQRSRRCAALSPRKYKSPIKKQNRIISNNKIEPIPPNQHKIPTGTFLEKLRFSKSTEGSSGELLVPKESCETNDLQVVNPCEMFVKDLEGNIKNKKSSEEISGFKESNNVLGTESQVPVILVDNENYNNSKCEITTVIPPPLQGPITAYSKRQYKKIHGVSPPKVEVKSVKKGNIPENINSKLKCSHKETEKDNKLESLTSKLQKDVQEIIKLGSPSKNSSPSTTNQSPGKQKQYNLPIKDELAKHIPLKPITEKLIIQCDLRDTLKDNHQNLANSVSLNETIGSILKKQRAGPYSPKFYVNANVVNKEKELKKENCCNISINRTVGKILPNPNKKAPDKLKISPATFGNLVSHALNSGVNVTLSRKADLGRDHAIERTCGLRKRKLTEMSDDEVSPQQGKKFRMNRNLKYVKKTNCMSSLFGESPVKCDNAIIKEVKPGLTQNPTKIRTPSPVEKITHPSSPTFPDSPSMDSDNHENLIIDTSLCSQNTSPRVSESDKKDIYETGDKPKVNNIGTNNESEPLQFHSDAGKKESAKNVKQSIIPFTLDTSARTMNNDEVQNNLIVNKATNDQRENITSLPQLSINNVNKLSKEDACDCQSLHNIDHNKLFTPNNSFQSGDNVKNIHVETSHSSRSLDKVLSPVKLSESQNQLGVDKDTAFKNTYDDKADGTRFIPSPPQLTMVSAFKHSENSVFALAEDTIGFVRILTRMRDLSPIRTPDKNDKSLIKTLSQYQQMDPTGLDHKVNEVSNKTSFEFIKPLNKDPKNKKKSLSFVPILNKTDNTSSKCIKVNILPTSAVLVPNKSEKQCSLEKYGIRNIKATETIQSFCNQSKVQENVHEQKNDEETANTVKYGNDNGKIKNKTAQSSKNPFRRKNPVRRIASEKIPELVTLHNVQTSTETNQEHSTKKRNSEKGNQMHLNDLDQINRAANTRNVPDITVDEVNRSLNENIDKNTIDKISNLKQDIKLTDRAKDPCGTKSASSDPKECLKKSLEPSNYEIDKERIFKRSESLKMVQKPLPRNYINVLKNIKEKTSENVFEVISSIAKKQNSEDFVSKEFEIYKMPDSFKDVNSISEMDRVSHIANINKKLRVSKYQNKSKKDSLNESNVSEALLMIPNKHPKIENDKLARKEKEHFSKTTRHSTSLNVSSKERKRNYRRSVSLGPEIRLGIHINLPLNKNKEETLSASHFKYENSHLTSPIQKISEKNIIMKHSDDLSKTPSKNCEEEIENPLKEDVSNRVSGTSNPLNSKSETDISKSPELNINATRTRKSRSKSPIFNKRSKSNHKLSHRKSPDFERKNCHNRPNSKSPEHNLSKYDYKYYSERSNSGSKRRRSRYEHYYKRSHSPEQKCHRSRSSLYKYQYRIDRSKRRNPDQRQKDFEVKVYQRKNVTKRSISYSIHSSDKSLRTGSPQRQKLDNNSPKNLNNFSRNQSNDMNKTCIINVGSGTLKKQDEKKSILSYEEEFERMRKEIEVLKNQVKNKNEGTVSKDSLNCNSEKESHSLTHQKSNYIDMELNVNKAGEQVQRNRSKNEKTNFNTVMGVENVEESQLNSEKLLHRPHTSKVSSAAENTHKLNQVSHDTRESTQLSMKKPTPIQIKRRARTLGDSEVKIVSIK